MQRFTHNGGEIHDGPLKEIDEVAITIDSPRRQEKNDKGRRRNQHERRMALEDKCKKEHKADHKAKKDNESRKRDNDEVNLTSRENTLNGRRKEEILVGVKIYPQGIVSRLGKDV